jgi:hypothetical protein
MHRAKEIDETSGQLENALILIECGIKRGVKSLEEVHNELITLSSLVYDVNNTKPITAEDRAKRDQKESSRVIDVRTSSNAFISFHRFHDLNDDAKLHLLLADSTDETLMKNMKTRALPFLQRLRKHDKDETLLLRRWMTSVAQGDRFHWCALIIQVRPSLKKRLVSYYPADHALQASRPIKENPDEGRIIQSPRELMRTALDVIYACPATSAHAIQQMGIIFEVILLQPFAFQCLLRITSLPPTSRYRNGSLDQLQTWWSLHSTAVLIDWRSTSMQMRSCSNSSAPLHLLPALACITLPQPLTDTSTASLLSR